MKVFENSPRAKELIDVISLAPSGGTNFELPLREAMEIIANQKFRKSDILFITDGECEINPVFLREFKEFKKKTETKVVGVKIFGEDETLVKFCDEVIPVESLDVESARSVYERIL